MPYRGGRILTGVNALKFVCAFLVVLIHTQSSPIVIFICRIAVPVFFIVSGYFLPGSDGTLNFKRLKTAGFRILRLYGLSSVIYLIWQVCFNINHPDRIIELFFDKNTWFNVFFVGDAIGVHLWYLLAYLQTVVIICLLYKFRIERFLYYMILPGILTNLFFGSYSSFMSIILEPDYMMSRNVFTIALPCISIGILLRRNEHHICKDPILLIVSCFVMLFFFAEDIFWLIQGFTCRGDIYLFTVPLSVCFFCMAVRCSKRIKDVSVLNTGGGYTTQIYITHIIPSHIVGHFLPEADGITLAVISFGSALVVAVICSRIYRLIMNESYHP